MCIHVRAGTVVRGHPDVLTCTHTNIHKHMHVIAWVFVCVFVCVCACACLCLCVCVRTHKHNRACEHIRRVVTWNLAAENLLNEQLISAKA